ncbi:MAG: hypothetical protein ACLGH3_01865 [Actinomycetota bacterium]
MKHGAWVAGALAGALLAVACGRGQPDVGASSHPSPTIPSPTASSSEPTTTWRFKDLTFDVPESWEVWRSRVVRMQGGFGEDGSLPASHDVALMVQEAPLEVGESFRRDAPLTRFEVAGRPGTARIQRVGSLDPYAESQGWRFVAVTHLRFSAGQVVRIEFLSTEAEEGENAYLALLHGLEFPEEIPPDVQRPPGPDALRSRIGEPVLERSQVPGTPISVELPASWFRDEVDPDRGGDVYRILMQRRNFVGTLIHFFARPGEASLKVEEFATDRDHDLGPQWEVSFTGTMATGAGTVDIVIGHGIPAAGGFCADGPEWQGVASLPPEPGEERRLALSLYGCDVPGMEALFRRIAASIDRA